MTEQTKRNEKKKKSKTNNFGNATNYCLNYKVRVWVGKL